MALQETINRARLKVWSGQPASFSSQTARIDADASIVGTDGQCKQGMDIAYNGIWGYSALLVSLANTAEPLYQSLHGANRPSHEGSFPSMTDPSNYAVKPGSPTSCSEATPTSRSRPSLTAGTPTGSASCSATTPRPTSSKPPNVNPKISTTS